MRILRTNINLPPGVVILLVILLIPFLLVFGFCYLICCAIFGALPFSPAGVFRRNRERGHSHVYGGPFRHAHADDDPQSDDDAIECEVISARTLDENGREIR